MDKKNFEKELTLCGKPIRVIEIHSILVRRNKRIINGKVYEWEEKRLSIFIPKHMWDEFYVLIPGRELKKLVQENSNR